MGYFPDDVVKELISGSVLTNISDLPHKGFMIQAATSVVTLASGIATITFPVEFPGGLIAVVACNGDTGANTQVVNGTRNASRTSFDVRAGSVNGAYRVNWFAIGW